MTDNKGVVYFEKQEDAQKSIGDLADLETSSAEQAKKEVNDLLQGGWIGSIPLSDGSYASAEFNNDVLTFYTQLLDDSEISFNDKYSIELGAPSSESGRNSPSGNSFDGLIRLDNSSKDEFSFSLSKKQEGAWALRLTLNGTSYGEGFAKAA